MNHSIGDGTSFWHFFNMWSETFLATAKGNKVPISRPPVLTRWFPDGHGPIINLPYNPQDFVARYNAPQLMERFFHFSSASIAKLKAKANDEANTTRISSFQALSALLWRTITRARKFSPDHPIGCRLAMNLRPKLRPPVSPYYFGNSIYPVRGETTSGELLAHNLGWSATILHEAVTRFSDNDAREFLHKWLQAPCIYQLGQLFDPNNIMMGSSPRFDMYGTQFGLGKAVMLRSGYANKFDGKVSSYPGYDGQGSVDLEVCLTPVHMKAFVNDPELLEAIAGTLK